MSTEDRLVSDRFPRASKYHPDWIMASVSGGANSLWLTEWLTTALDLRPGMRVLDLGCGADARSLPFAAGFFDAIVSIDSFVYGILDIERADSMPDGWRFWLDWHKVVAPDNAAEINALEIDRGRYFGYVRVVSRRRGETALGEHPLSVPTTYSRKPLLRSEG
jgi:hypothetical protein